MSTIPMPGSWIKGAVHIPDTRKDKSAFTLSEHLTTRPLKENEGLKALKKQLRKERSK